MVTQINDLPDEILSHIFVLLLWDHVHTKSIDLVCRRWRTAMAGMLTTVTQWDLYNAGMRPRNGIKCLYVCCGKMAYIPTPPPDPSTEFILIDGDVFTLDFKRAFGAHTTWDIYGDQIVRSLPDTRIMLRRPDNGMIITLHTARSSALMQIADKGLVFTEAVIDYNYNTLCRFKRKDVVTLFHDYIFLAKYRPDGADLWVIDDGEHIHLGSVDGDVVVNKITILPNRYVLLSGKNVLSLFNFEEECCKAIEPPKLYNTRSLQYCDVCFNSDTFAVMVKPHVRVHKRSTVLVFTHTGNLLRRIEMYVASYLHAIHPKTGCLLIDASRKLSWWGADKRSTSRA
jgi:hypothetical protein